MQVKVEATIANGHQIDAPRRFRLAVHADANGKRLAPTLSDERRALSADQHIGIDVVKLNHRAKSQAAHGSERPGYLGPSEASRASTACAAAMRAGIGKFLFARITTPILYSGTKATYAPNPFVEPVLLN